LYQRYIALWLVEVKISSLRVTEVPSLRVITLPDAEEGFFLRIAPPALTVPLALIDAAYTSLVPSTGRAVNVRTAIKRITCDFMNN
jgi:hypothetical protein